MEKPILTVSELVLPGSEALVEVADARLRAKAMVAGRAVLVRAGDEVAVEAEIAAIEGTALRVRALGRVAPDGSPLVEHGYGAGADERVVKLRVLGGFSDITTTDPGRFADQSAASLSADERRAVL